jgi:hypothetical protein
MVYAIKRKQSGNGYQWHEKNWIATADGTFKLAL